MGTGAPYATGALSLFTTCPDLPTHGLEGGRMVLDSFTISQDPEETGVNEQLGGTITSTLTRVGSIGPFGAVRATFDFSPPRRQLSTFK